MHCLFTHHTLDETTGHLTAERIAGSLGVVVQGRVNAIHTRRNPPIAGSRRLLTAATDQRATRL